MENRERDRVSQRVSPTGSGREVREDEISRRDSGSSSSDVDRSEIRSPKDSSEGRH